jgi:hypothetical protein
VICSLFFARQAASLLGRACIVRALQRGQPDLRAGNFVAERAANLGLPVDIVGLSSTSPDAAIRHATWDRFSQALCRPTSRRETSLGRTSSCGPDSTAPSQCWQRHLALSSTDLAATSRHSIDSGSLTRTFPTHNPTQRFTTRFGGCRSTLSTGSPTRVRFYLYLRPRLKVSVSSPLCYETLRQTS